MRRLLSVLSFLGALTLGAWPISVAAQSGGFAAAQEAADDGEWDMALALAADEGQVARDLITWTRLRQGAASLDDYVAFLDTHPDWPALDRLRRAAEETIPSGWRPDAVAAFFDGHPPQTGTGALRLAEALTELGRSDEAQAVLTQAWLTLGLDDLSQAALLAAFGTELAPHHLARAEAMLWRWRTSDAARLLALLPADRRALAEARIALIRNSSNAGARIAAVPAALRDDPGLAYDLYTRAARRGDYSEAIAIIDPRSDTAETLGEPWRWAGWRANLARWLMREGQAQEAYDLAARHHLTAEDPDGAYTDLEWLSGYLALTYLDDPEAALAHFQAVEASSSGPISLSRGGYWIGRAYEVLGDPAAAEAALARAAGHQTAYYGLLAADRLGLPLDPSLTGRDHPGDWQDPAFRADPRVQALELLLDVEERGAAVFFVRHLAEEAARAEDALRLTRLGALLDARDEAFLTVLAGKSAAAVGLVEPAVYFPLHPLAEMDLPAEPALSLAIARRESEFNPVVGSPVGALGLMQLMPATAREVAGQMGLPYARARLTSDWRYNARLGARYLADLQEMFGDSPVMIAAGYNAGPSRPRLWMAQRGDPRFDGTDVVDWIEHIPFNETRNYVMRVTESLPVYRARLTGEAGPLEFLELLEGSWPLIRPEPRPGSVPVEEASASGVASGPVTSLRPLARPQD